MIHIRLERLSAGIEAEKVDFLRLSYEELEKSCCKRGEKNVWRLNLNEHLNHKTFLVNTSS